MWAARPSGTDGARVLEHLRVMDVVPFRSDPRRRSSPAMSQVDPRRRVPICNATATVRHSPWQIRPLLVFFECFYRADVVLCSFCVAGP